MYFPNGDLFMIRCNDPKPAEWRLGAILKSVSFHDKIMDRQADGL
jgi:hypothetical protein